MTPGQDPPPGHRRGELGKRVLDLSLALPALLLLAFPILVIALIIRSRMGAPVIFRAVRAGRDGRPFILFKFRTMLDLRDATGRLLADEARITGLGRFLRRTSLDELPQLFNVVRGEMSLVGPRPLLVEYLGRYSPDQARRLEVRPGITGWAQVNGRNGLSWEEKFDLDLWYVNHTSILLDLKILAQTIFQVFRRESVDAGGDLSVPRFMGSAPAASPEPSAGSELPERAGGAGS
jgi:lipopolysaccharide/colanic/teichoic acid biosynthesis glycosyltransferase